MSESLMHAASPVAPTRPSTLAYAPAPLRRGRRIRRILLSIVLLALVTPVIIWRVPLWAHAQLIWWQHACSSFSVSPDSIVATTSRTPTNLVKTPDAWIHYESYAPGNIPSRGTLPKTIVFLHQRQSPSGHQRIVAIRCIPIYLASASILQSLQPIVVEPASLWHLDSRPKFTPGPNHGGYPVSIPINLYAGQPDPKDDSHFTLAYTLNGKPGTIDGWLNDDETVKLELRAGSPSMRDELRASTQPSVNR